MNVISTKCEKNYSRTVYWPCHCGSFARGQWLPGQRVTSSRLTLRHNRVLTLTPFRWKTRRWRIACVLTCSSRRSVKGADVLQQLWTFKWSQFSCEWNRHEGAVLHLSGKVVRPQEPDVIIRWSELKAAEHLILYSLDLKWHKMKWTKERKIECIEIATDHDTSVDSKHYTHQINKNTVSRVLSF